MVIESCFREIFQIKKAKTVWKAASHFPLARAEARARAHNAPRLWPEQQAVVLMEVLKTSKIRDLGSKLFCFFVSLYLLLENLNEALPFTK